MENIDENGKSLKLFSLIALLFSSLPVIANNESSVPMADSIEQFFSPQGLIVSKAYYPLAESARQILETQKKLAVLIVLNIYLNSHRQICNLSFE